MEVKFKKLRETAIMPTKSTAKAAAFDVYTSEMAIISKGRNILPTGFAIQMPSHIKANVRSRSGMSLKGFEGYSYVTDANGAVVRDNDTSRFDADVILGLVDADYTGEVGVIVKSDDDRDFIIPAGMRVAQLEFAVVPNITMIEVGELDETERGNNGFGHTGNR